MAFLGFKDEASATQQGALIAIALITVSLAALSVSGAIATSSGNDWVWIIRIAFAFIITGAEALAAFALTRVMVAPNLFRKVVGSVIFVGLAWVCVQNAKNGVHFIFPDRFAESADSLTAKAKLADVEAQKLQTASQAALDSGPQELARVRGQIAALNVEQRKMAAQSPEGIKEAQALLLAQGKYFGRVDGIRENLTEAAMRARGEEIQGELADLSQQEKNLLSGASAPVQTASTDKAVQKIELEAAASAAFWAAIWLEVMLWVLEGARSLGLWVFVMSQTGKSVARVRDLEDEIAVAKLEAELAKIRGGTDPQPDPVDNSPQPIIKATEIPVDDQITDDGTTSSVNDEADLPPPLEDDLTPAQRRARKGGQAAQHARRADRNQKKIPVTDDRVEDEMFEGVE